MKLPKKIRIGSRKSKLALIQTDMVIQMIKAHFPKVEMEVVTMQTLGDRLLNQSLNKIGGKGVFTQELEQALLQGEIDMAVHSAKDMPLIMQEGVSLYPVGKREDASDVLISCRTLKKDESFIVGTSSLRRSIQIKQIYPKSTIKDIRGNVETRLQKLLSGEFDAIVLANAGLIRIAPKAKVGFLERFHYTLLDKTSFMPAACQGILALECRKGEFKEMIAVITEEETRRSFEIEREFLRIMAGGCNAPCGIHTEIVGKKALVNAFFAKEEATDEKKFEIIGEYGFREKRDIKSSKLNRIKRVSWVISSLDEIRDLVGALKYGRVSLVGAGIGSEEHLTLKALSFIREADCIVYDKLLAPSILNEARLTAELIYVGKSSKNHSMKQKDINDLLVKLAKSGKNVVRLKGGDPFVFGRGSEEALHLKKEGIEFDFISGISSCIAVPENVRIPVTHRGVASSFHVITGHEMNGEAKLDEYIAKLSGTLVFLMGLSNAGKIANELVEYGKDENTKVAVISKGMSVHEKVYVTTLKELENLVKIEEIKTPVIIVMGDVVGIGQELGEGINSNLQDEFCERVETLSYVEGKKGKFVQRFGEWQEMDRVKNTLPLFGKSVLITGTRSMVNKLRPEIRKAGGRDIAISLIETIYEPSVEFEPAMENLKDYSYLIFTSSNGVDAFFKYIRDLATDKKGFDQRQIAHLKIAVIGEGSRDTLRSYGYVEDFMPSEFTSIHLADELLSRLTKSDKVLLVRAKEANPYLTQQLKRYGISYTDAYIYRTYVDERRKDELQRVLTDIDYVTLASPSAVSAFRKMMGELIFENVSEDMREGSKFEEYHFKIASIGPETTKECKKQGLSVDITAKVNTAKGLVQAMGEMGEE